VNPGTGRSSWIRVVNRAYENLPKDTTVTRAQIRAVLMNYARAWVAVDLDRPRRLAMIAAAAAEAYGITIDQADAILSWCGDDAALVLASPVQERRTATRRRARITASVLAEVAEERVRQFDKWGEQNWPDGTGPNVVWWQAFSPEAANAVSEIRERTDARAAAGMLTWLDIAEEEFAESAAEKDSEKLRAELVQLVAVGVAWIEAIDRRKS